MNRGTEERIASLAADSRAAAARFGERAHAEGLVDVAYDTLDSPLGPLLAAVTPAGLVRLAYTEHSGEESVFEHLATRVSPRVLRAPRRLEPVRRQLGEYFEGSRREFDLPTDHSLMAPFASRILEHTAAIPYGAVSTYAEVAAQAGSPRGARAAGNALGSNPIPIVIPCHRVLRAGHSLGGYTGGLDKKVELLRIEGVALA